MKKLVLNRDTIKVLSDLNKIVGGISSDCSRVVQCVAPLSAGCPR